MSVETLPSVADLVERARNPRASMRQQHAAFTQLVERFEAMAFVSASRACREAETARDLCQEAFLAAWRLLPQLREPAAFGGWLQRLVRTQVSRAARRSRTAEAIRDAMRSDSAIRAETYDPAERAHRSGIRRSLASAVAGLPAAEREAVVRFHFLGESLRDTARATGVSVGTAGKRVYAGRLRLRQALPRSLARAFLTVAPSPSFRRRVEDGVFDEFTGEYRFVNHRERRVVVRREGHVLAGYANGQRNVLASPGTDVLVTTEFDGEARFARDRRGRIRRFVYYEFGRRLGVARKITQGDRGARSRAGR